MKAERVTQSVSKIKNLCVCTQREKISEKCKMNDAERGCWCLQPLFRAYIRILPLLPGNTVKPEGSHPFVFSQTRRLFCATKTSALEPSYSVTTHPLIIKVIFPHLPDLQEQIIICLISFFLQAHFRFHLLSLSILITAPRRRSKQKQEHSRTFSDIGKFKISRASGGRIWEDSKDLQPDNETGTGLLKPRGDERMLNSFPIWSCSLPPLIEHLFFFQDQGCVHSSLAPSF